MPFDPWDNQYTLIAKIVQAIHDRWAASPSLFSSEPPRPMHGDTRVVLYRKLLAAVEAEASAGGGFSERLVFLALRAGGLLGPAFDELVLWQTPSIGATNFSGGIWTCPASGDYFVSERVTLESLANGEVYSDTCLVNGSPGPTVENALESLITGDPGTIVQSSRAFRITLSAGNTLAFQNTLSGATGATVLTGPLAGDSGAGSEASYWAIFSA